MTRLCPNDSGRSLPRSQDLRRSVVSFRPCFPRTATKASAQHRHPLARFRWETAGCCGGVDDRLPRSRRPRTVGGACAPRRLEDVADQGRARRQHRPGQALRRTMVCGQALPRVAPACGRGPVAGQHGERAARTAARLAANPRAAATGPALGRGWGEGDRANQGSVGTAQAAGRDEAPPEGRPQDMGVGRAARDKQGCLMPPVCSAIKENPVFPSG